MYQIIVLRPDGRELFLGSADKAADAYRLHQDLAAQYPALKVRDAYGSDIKLDELQQRALAEKSSGF